jgi:hypothetical protein
VGYRIQENEEVVTDRYVGFRDVDSRKRISLAGALTSDTKRLSVSVATDGTIHLTPMVVMPKKELDALLRQTQTKELPSDERDNTNS